MEAKKGSVMQRAACEYAQREHANREAQRARRPTNPPTHDQIAMHRERMSAIPAYRSAYLSETARLDRGHGVV
ncbi:MAG: hypothetical protein M0Z99_34765 [Betaproteobacteria bacterium]|nr:hypothetical protein [Betaproteobacteria bacterium]